MKGTIKRCFHCNAMVLPSDVEKGGCQECGSRRLRIAPKISDEEEARAIAAGYEFDQEGWADKPTEGEAFAYRD